MANTIEIDGSEGEGGGQVLRSALALSIITRTAVRIVNIRAKRKRPGLLRQHLTAVQAATAISGAMVRGDRLGSSELSFEPGAPRGGSHRFAVGTAGSAMLVLQTVLWPLLVGSESVEIEVEGGTHNPLAPPFEFVERVLVPHVRRMGGTVDIELLRAGFYPAGGGCVRLRVEGGSTLRPVALLERGAIVRRRAHAMVSNLSRKIAHRELSVLRSGLALDRSEFEASAVDSPGPGNVVWIEAEFAEGRESFAGFGEKGVPAETVAERVLEAYAHWESHDVPVGEHLADQLLIPMVLAGGGSFRTTAPTLHTRTNASIVHRFVGLSTRFDDEGGGVWRVTVAGN